VAWQMQGGFNEKSGTWIVRVVAAVTVATAAKADNSFLTMRRRAFRARPPPSASPGVETFNSRPTGTGPGFTTDYGTGGAITGTYSGPSGVQINPADVFGGAGGIGNYVVAFGNTPYTLSLVADPILDPQGINYFGYWCQRSTTAIR
jgi:hypothetical protein